MPLLRHVGSWGPSGAVVTERGGETKTKSPRTLAATPGPRSSPQASLSCTERVDAVDAQNGPLHWAPEQLGPLVLAMSDDEYMSSGHIVDEDDENDLNDDDYRPSAAYLVPMVGESPQAGKQQKKRGRKPNPNPYVRSAREAARKASHSVIEKKRRERINQALTELRTLVPAEENPGTANPGKDFKLEVLIRTVSHLKSLVTRVEELESTVGNRAAHPFLPVPSPLSSSSSQGSVCKVCKTKMDQTHRHERVELPPVSTLLTGLPSPPPSGSLSDSSATVAEVPSLQLPRSKITHDHVTLTESPPLPPSHARPELSRYDQAAAAYSLLHMSERDRVRQTPWSLLNTSTNPASR
ncbi:hypothetical protein CPB86DRAFT_794975 [Serendipita vermifera]|nr:hypothetical protein CPB86DRAFT_794975 [Serendipita vermifera]